MKHALAIVVAALARGLPLVALACIGGGLAWWLHPGLGLLAVGALIWLDLSRKDPRP